MRLTAVGNSSMDTVSYTHLACSVPHLIEGYSGDGIPNKTKYIERLERKIPGKVAVGCTSIAAFDLYEKRLREDVYKRQPYTYVYKDY